MPFAERVSHLKAEGAYAVMARAQELEAQGRHIIHLEIGQPDFPTFPEIALAGIRAISEGKTRYNPPAGVPDLREALARRTSERLGIPISPSQVIVAPGAKPMIFFPLMALVEPGDEVVYPDPGFPTYEAAIRVAGGVPVPIPLREESDFAPDRDALKAAIGPKTRVIILNSPSNPTGSILSADDLELIADLAQKWDCWILSDEIYRRFVYDGAEYRSIASYPDMARRVVIVDGFSKTYAMTGWRLGYGIMPEELAERVELLITHSVGCTATFTQWAGLEAVIGPQDRVDAVMAEFAARREVIVRGLNAMPGISCRSPQGAFYAFPNIVGTGMSSDELAAYILDRAGVAVLPGTAFGKNGEGYLRICYANSMDNIKEALGRIGDAISAL